MDLLANENFPSIAVTALRQAGHDVLWVRTAMPAADDESILARAQAERRILLTFDKDFGELAFRAGLPAECGIILFRFAIPSPNRAADRVLAVLSSRTEWAANFAVVEEARIRIRSVR